MTSLSELRLGNLTVDLRHPIDISIPMLFNGPQPNAYDVDGAISQACRSEDLVGDTRHGGSCNFEQYTLIPHCNGTHTECVGHITHERISIRECLKDSLVPSVLISVEPVFAGATSDTYSADFGKDDRVITRELLLQALSGNPNNTFEMKALIIRTLPNDDRKLTRKYGDDIPPYFSTEAIGLVVAQGIDHLIVDLPSIDRLFDQGLLSNHRSFWSVEPGSFEIDKSTRMHSTVTELAYVPNDVPDGLYVVNLQVPPFMSDAAPSRPILFAANPD